MLDGGVTRCFLKQRRWGPTIFGNPDEIEVPCVDIFQVSRSYGTETESRCGSTLLRQWDDHGTKCSVVVNAFRGPNPLPRIAVDNARLNSTIKLSSSIRSVGNAAALVPERKRHAVTWRVVPKQTARR